MQSGPIQLIVFAFDRVDRFRGQIMRELDELRGHGLIRVLDLQFVMKEPDGTIRAIQERDLPNGSVYAFGALLDPLLGAATTFRAHPEAASTLEAMLSPEQGPGLSLDEIRNAAATLAPGTAAAFVLVEHAWAISLGTAIREAGGRMIAQGFLTRDALLVVRDELNAIVATEVANDQSAAIRGAALLDTLTTLAAVEEIQQAAIADAAAIIVGVERFRTAVAAEAVRELVVAGLLSEADAVEAIDVLVDAELITDEALQQATEAAEVALAEITQD